jgi:hypothetical protein
MENTILLLLHKIEIEPIDNNIANKLTLLLDEINYLLLKIKFCQNLQEANPYFELLDKIQLVVAKLHYKNHINLSRPLQQFIIDFNELHDNNERERLFNEIKQNQHMYTQQRERILLKLLQEIENEPIKTDLLPQLHFIQNEISLFFAKIKTCETLEAANEYFDLLEKIQNTLAILSFKYEIKLPSNLNKFVSDCDRLDDSWLREHLFNKIKNNKYPQGEE